jgi:hypothetical protein
MISEVKKQTGHAHALSYISYFVYITPKLNASRIMKVFTNVIPNLAVDPFATTAVIKILDALLSDSNPENNVLGLRAFKQVLYIQPSVWRTLKPQFMRMIMNVKNGNTARILEVAVLLFIKYVFHLRRLIQ